MKWELGFHCSECALTVYQQRTPTPSSGRSAPVVQVPSPALSRQPWMSRCLLEQLVLMLPLQQPHRRVSKTARNNRNPKYNALGSEGFIKETAKGNWNNHRQAGEVITAIKMVSVLLHIIFPAPSWSWRNLQSRCHKLLCFCMTKISCNVSIDFVSDIRYHFIFASSIPKTYT